MRQLPGHHRESSQVRIGKIGEVLERNGCGERSVPEDEAPVKRLPMSADG